MKIVKLLTELMSKCLIWYLKFDLQREKVSKLLSFECLVK